MPALLSEAALARALCVRDLTDPAGGAHAMQMLVDAAIAALRRSWGCAVHIHRAHPVVSVADNYDHLHYPPDGAARDARYTRWVTPGTLLRTQTSALVPPALRALARAPQERDVLLACPGIVYRRDCVDRMHSGEPHQIDLWRLRRGARLNGSDLEEMIHLVVAALLPRRALRTVPAAHPYTEEGLQIDVDASDAGAASWVEMGECGLALPALLEESGLGPGWSGLAMGIGLDRALMLHKGIADIRLLREADPRVARQMLDLQPYRAVSAQPAVARDLSIATGADTTAEELGDAVRGALGERADEVEAVEIISETPHAALPPAAAARLGMRADQKNVLLRVVIRHPVRALTHAEANQLRDAIYGALHQGTVHQWASGRSPGGDAR
jgi:phenylalanyl-tRNA synthetase alpha chain